jgi:hypothetical protein
LLIACFFQMTKTNDSIVPYLSMHNAESAIATY